MIVLAGATGAMGSQICESLARKGHQILAIARTESALSSLVKVSDNIIPCVADISKDVSIDVIKGMITSPVDMVLQGAGVATAGGVLNAPIGAVIDSVNIKVGGMLRLVRAADSALAQDSRLVAIGGHYGFEPTAYAATAGVANAALINLIKQLSLAYGPRGVTSHLIAPGPTETDRLYRVASDRAQRDGKGIDEILNAMKAESSLGAFTTISQVVWAVELLLAKEACALTGSTLFMDAGRRKSAA